MVKQKETIYSATWVKRKYCVGGEFVRPVPGEAPEEYDPFAAGYFGPQGTSPGRSVYLQLLDVQTSEPASLERFCSQWGLLGLLPHSLVQWQRAAPAGASGTVAQGPGYSTRFGAGLAGHPSEYREATLPARGTVLFRDGMSGTLCQIPARDYFRQFFPGLDGDVPFDLDSPEVWEHLCEPVHHVWNAIVRFKRAYQQLSAWQTQKPLAPGEAPPPPRLIIRDGKAIVPRPTLINGGSLLEEWLWVELAGVRHIPPQFLKTPDIRYRLFFPSLLACCYVMLIEDFTIGRGLRYCQNEHCLKPFVQSRPDQDFCRTECRDAQHQREYRRREAAKKKGLPVPERPLRKARRTRKEGTA